MTNVLARRRRRFDPQPTQPAAVLLASTGVPFTRAAVRQAVRLADGGPVAVVTVARLYGSQFGLPNPGLLPTRRELADQRTQVDAALRAVTRAGGEGWGQVAVTRRPGRTIARVAAARGVRHVVVAAPVQPRWRRVVEGDPVAEVRRRVPDHVAVHGAPVGDPASDDHRPATRRHDHRAAARRGGRPWPST